MIVPEKLKRAASAARTLFFSDPVPFLAGIPAVFMMAVLFALHQDGAAVFEEQKDALTLEVFSLTGLGSGPAAMLKKEIESLPGVERAEAVSPAESLDRVAADPQLRMEAKWLLDKAGENPGKELFPWSYRVWPARWDPESRDGLVGRIRSIPGPKGGPAAAEIHYDPDRWELVLDLANVLRWISGVLALVIYGLVLGAAASGWLILKKARGRFRPVLGAAKSAVVSGIAMGTLCHVLRIATLSTRFLPGTWLWRNEIGGLLPLEISLAALWMFCASGLASGRGEAVRTDA